MSIVRSYLLLLRSPQSRVITTEQFYLHQLEHIFRFSIRSLSLAFGWSHLSVGIAVFSSVCVSMNELKLLSYLFFTKTSVNQEK